MENPIIFGNTHVSPGQFLLLVVVLQNCSKTPGDSFCLARVLPEIARRFGTLGSTSPTPQKSNELIPNKCQFLKGPLVVFSDFRPIILFWGPVRFR